MFESGIKNHSKTTDLGFGNTSRANEVKESVTVNVLRPIIEYLFPLKCFKTKHIIRNAYWHIMFGFFT